MAKPVRNALNWFEIPVSDMTRAARFYGAVFEPALEPGPSAPDYQMAMFSGANGVNGALMQGEGYVPSRQGAVLYLNGGDDLDAVLSRVEAAGGEVLTEKADIGDGNGFFAYFYRHRGQPRRSAFGGLMGRFAVGITKPYLADVLVSDVLPP